MRRPGAGDRLADRARPASGRRCCGSTRPSNPTGRVLPVDHLRKVVDWCRERGTLLVSDECYLECAWEAGSRSRCCTPTSAAAPSTGCSPSTRCPSGPTWPATGAASSPATRRVVAELLAVRKNLGLMMPGPQQRGDGRGAAPTTTTSLAQHATYAARRAVLRGGAGGGGLPGRPLRGVALPVGDPRRPDCWETVAWFAERGILVAPGAFYGAGRRAARPDRVHRDRRAGRGRGRPAGWPTAPAVTVRSRRRRRRGRGRGARGSPRSSASRPDVSGS